ncbi:MAG: hypothetical protein ACPHID_02705 [Thermoplasmatota archaeon]
MPACPACGDDLPPGSTVRCRCGQWSRIEEAPEQPCQHCDGVVPVLGPTGRCLTCQRLQSTGGRELRVVADCPRCRRRLDVREDQDEGTCHHCGTAFLLRDTL